MSLLEGKKDKYEFQYQLDISFDKQLELLDSIGTFYSYVDGMAVPKLSKVWNFIKDKITITEIEGEKEFLIWKNGSMVDDKFQKMLAVSVSSSKWFLEAFGGFMSDQGVVLD